jgi:hypothetical protein
MFWARIGAVVSRVAVCVLVVEVSVVVFVVLEEPDMRLPPAYIGSLTIWLQLGRRRQP